MCTTFTRTGTCIQQKILKLLQMSYRTLYFSIKIAWPEKKFCCFCCFVTEYPCTVYDPSVWESAQPSVSFWWKCQTCEEWALAKGDRRCCQILNTSQTLLRSEMLFKLEIIHEWMPNPLFRKLHVNRVWLLTTYYNNAKANQCNVKSYFFI